jgi:hypothetical protein
VRIRVHIYLINVHPSFCYLLNYNECCGVMDTLCIVVAQLLLSLPF